MSDQAENLAAAAPAIVFEPAAPPSSDGQGASEEESESVLLPYPVVGIGASAGGLEAYLELLRQVPADVGLAIVLVPHLHPHQPSHLVEILSREIALPVSFISDGITPEPNHVYVLPPNQRVRMAQGTLRLEPRPEGDRVPMPVDLFFRSLGADQKRRAIGVVLSGTDSDGALGLKALKGEGGIAIVQQPETARFDGMPRSGIAADHVDLVLAPADIGRELVRVAANFPIADAPLTENRVEEQHLLRIFKALQGVSGIDFRRYKQSTIRRRIARRMLLKKTATLGDYGITLLADPREAQELQEDLLINVTRFFRDPEMYEAMERDILPGLLRSHQPDTQFRVWIAGCSTGEEVYSLAMCLLEALRDTVVPQIQIFGTDASARSIEIARAGSYPVSIAQEISTERLRQYFVANGQGYQVTKRVRDMCVFARQNLSTDPPFSRLDLISCRNVLIYLGPELQRTVLSTFHYALKPGGRLVLGSSEAIRNFQELFQPLDRKQKIYAKLDGVRPLPVPLATRLFVPEVLPLPAPVHRETTEIDLQEASDRVVLAHYGPPGVLINEQMEIVQSRGRTSLFLEIPPGAPSFHLPRLLREPLLAAVEPALRHAIRHQVPVHVDAMEIVLENSLHSVAVEVLPLPLTGSRSAYFLVLFIQGQGLANAARVAAQAPFDLEKLAGSDDRELAQLRRDVATTKIFLQGIIEERDLKNQELLSANEELQSSTEEMQSVNEELETAKEELQSANEELTTVNEELHTRNAELNRSTSDLLNLLSSVNIPVLMLGNDLHIRHVTPPSQRLLNIRPGDIGRPISDIRMNLTIGELEPIFREVLETLGTKEVEVQDKDGQWYLLRVRPYRTLENRIEGVVMLLVNIDQVRRSQQELQEAHEFSQQVIENVQIPLVVLQDDLRIQTANKAFRGLSGFSLRDLTGRHFADLIAALWGGEALRPKLEALRAGEGGTGFEYEFEWGTSERCTYHLNAHLVQRLQQRVILVTIEDISARKQIEQMLQEDKLQLEGQVQSTTLELDRTKEELRALAASLFTAQDEDRRRLARELHDDLSQRLAVLEVETQGLQQGLTEQNESMRPHLEAIRRQAEGLSRDVRTIAHQLHPSILDDLGLPFALQALVEELRHREGMVATFTRRQLPPALPREVAACLYRVAQEALRNVAKHAGQTHVKVTLTGLPDAVQLTIADFGEGFDAKDVRRGLGLISMEERIRLVQGKVSIDSQLGKGTTVQVMVPLPASGTA